MHGCVHLFLKILGEETDEKRTEIRSCKSTEADDEFAMVRRILLITQRFLAKTSSYACYYGTDPTSSILLSYRLLGDRPSTKAKSSIRESV
jgi:hypothetical protein